MVASAHPSAIRARFAAMAVRNDADLDLGEAALLIAAEAHPGLDVDAWLRRLDAVADDARGPVGRAHGALGRVAALVAHLFGTVGLRGNSTDYTDPRNSYLNDVLDRRTGIPISLAVVLIEVGRRLDIPLDGVGFPAHFLVSCRDVPDTYIDPFHGGRFLTVGDCEAFLESLTGGSVAFRLGYLAPIPRRAILVRMLRNLRAVHTQRGDIAAAIAAIDRMLLLDPDQPQELLARGLLHYEAHAWRDAVSDLDRYTRENSDAPDVPLARSRAVQAREKLLALN